MVVVAVVVQQLLLEVLGVTEGEGEPALEMQMELMAVLEAVEVDPEVPM